jgi:heme A synthase
MNRLARTRRWFFDELRMDRLALYTAIMTLLMIVIGAVTRVTESGMGCGTYWPNCNGHIIPEFNDAATVIEFGHRLFALLVGIFALAVIVKVWRQQRRESRIFGPAALGFVLYFVQSGLGAITVKLNNEWVSVSLHLANSMLLLACYLILWVNARQLGAETRGAARLPLSELLLTTVLTFIVAIIGAAVAGNNATKACVGWPLCAGQIWPAEQGPLQMLNMLHRIAAGALGLLLVLLLIQSVSSGINLVSRNLLIGALALYIAQAALGALVVLIAGRDPLIVVRSLHVLFAAATWSVMVIVSTVSWLQLPLRSASRTEPVGVPSVTTLS